MHWGIRTERHKLIRFPHVDSFEFYDLQKDPHEMNDASAEAGYSEIIKGTETKLSELMKEVGVTREYLLAHMKNNRRAPPKSYGRGKKKK